MVFLGKDISFPDVQTAAREGLLAIGGDLSVDRLLLAYRSGIFPWFESDEPILWWSPDPRFVLFPDELHVSKSMRKLIRDEAFQVSFDKCFEEVILNCAKVSRRGQKSSWITAGMIESYSKLNEAGFIRSVEVWEDDQLVGGLYGVDLDNGIFCGESMFSLKSNASKFGLIKFLESTQYKLIDCQVHTPHLESLGARMIPREVYLDYLN